MTRHFGAPVKAVALTAGGRRVRGEFVITRHGIEGGAVYALGPALRDGAPLVLDLVPDLPAHAIATASVAHAARRACRITSARRWACRR
jgi:predicted flavoprotein YhiN